MLLTTLISSFVLAVVALSAAAPQPQPRTNAEALARGLPLKKPRMCDTLCQEDRLSHRPKPSKTAIPPFSVKFSKTCHNVVYDFSNGCAVMTGTCKDSGRNWHTTSIDLNACISHSKDTLMCMPGDFTTSGGCTHCYVDGETLKCMCHDSKGKPSKVSLNLNECIGNMEGHLYCDKHD